MNTELQAIIRLLQDDDPSTVKLVKEQLAGRGPDFLPDLREMLHADDERVSQHVADVLFQIDAREAGEALTALCEHFPEKGDLEAGAWLIARVLRHGIDLAPARVTLDEWGREAARFLQGAEGATDRVNVLGEFLGKAMQMRGNSEDYYNPENSLLPRVIETRRGIPITLALVYILVGQRAGMAIEGVNFPGHFLARHEGVLFDPFDRGRILSDDDCVLILERQNLTPQPLYFETATPLAMLTRILANLLYIYQTAEELDRAEQLSGWIRQLTSH